MTMRPRIHKLVRFLSLALIAVSLTYAASRTHVRRDLTAEGLSQITEQTRELLASITPERPVVVHAYVSREVPRAFVPVRSRLLNVLREMQAIGGDGLTVRIVEPEPYSEAAQEAVDKFGITPRRMLDREAGRTEELQVFLGLVFVSGPREEVIPFMDRGLSVEYEIARALRMVTQDKKKVVGIFRTDAAIMGDFDLQARTQKPAWRIVDELRKQYEVRTLNPNTDVPDDVDVLIVPQLSSTSQAQLDVIRKYVDAGRPALLTIDPLPLFDLRVAPTEPMINKSGGGFGGGPPPEPKGDYKGLLRDFGVVWDDTKVLYDTYNPHPTFRDVPPHVIFVTERPDGTAPFQDADPIVDGLSEVVVLFAGEIQPAEGHEGEFVPLLETGRTAGFNRFDEMVQRHMLFGLSGPIIPRTRSPIDGQNHLIAARVAGGAASGEGAKPRNLIVIADLDLFGDQFFAMHERGGDIDGDGLQDIRFDNVTFLMNAVDSLAGDERFVELRKRRPRYRRLTTVEDLTKEARAEREREIEEANAAAERELDEAQKALDAAVAKIQERTDLDETTKAIMIKSVEAAENRRLQAKQERIELEKARRIGRIEMEHARKIDEVRDRIRLLAVLLTPLPALLMGGWIFSRRRRRERESIPDERRHARSGAPPPRTGPKAPTPGEGDDSDDPQPEVRPDDEEGGAA